MATLPIKVPSVGESITEGILARWLKPPGSLVKAGEPLFELETDKASNVVNAPGDGVFSTKVSEGTTVAVGSTIGEIDPNGKPATGQAPKPETARAPAQPASAAPQAKTSASEPPLSPAARRMATEEQIDTAGIKGSGPSGTIVKDDLVKKDAQAPAEPSVPAEAREPQPPLSGERRQTRQRMSGIRQKIAQRLVEAQQTAAILTTFNEADLSEVIELRKRHKEAFQKKHGVGLGFMSFFVKAAVEALKAFPSVNGRIDGTDIIHNHYYDIGVAVNTERGLMVPVVRDADRLSFAGIEKAIADFAKKARENTISVDDLSGGTFTITNGGVFGSLLSTPILNPPQSAILGMHTIQKRPVAVDDAVVIRPMMYLALSYDHRIVDGREAVSFLVRIKECVENPERVMLDV